jgi:hypothetical protein
MSSTLEPIINYPDKKKGYFKLFYQWDWEFFFSFSFDTQVDSGQAFKEVKRWIKYQRHRFGKIKFGCIMIFSNPNDDNPHVHMLAASDPRYPRRLTDISFNIHRFIQSSWEHDPLNHKKKPWEDRTCRITTNRQWTNEKICNYVSKLKNITLHKPDNWHIDYYRKSVLENLKVRPLP